jgi:hypothetical protein
MAKWKRVTRIDGVLIDINMDRVEFLLAKPTPPNSPQTTTPGDIAVAVGSHSVMRQR